MCCKVLAVDELAKAAGTACVHLARGGGCGIYAERPHACRTFECVWLMDPEMPHRFRPDQTKVMLDQDAGGMRLIARCDPGNPQAWRRQPIYGALKVYAAQHWGAGRIVLAVAGRHTWLVAPREDVDLGEVAPGADLKITEGPGGVSVDVGAPP
jgi:hypothetical protein